MSKKIETKEALEELAELKMKKKEIDQEIKEIQDWIFNYGDPIDRYETENGEVLVKVSQTKYEVEDQSKIIRSLRGMGYNKAEMLAMAKFKIGELRRRVGDDKIQRWLDNGGVREMNSTYYKLSDY